MRTRLGRTQSGFSLLELLLVLALSSILAYLGVGAYQHLRQGLESEQAKVNLLGYSQQLLYYHQQHQSYADDALQLADSDRYDYQLEIDSAGANFLLLALPQAKQAGAGALSLDNIGTRKHYQSDSAQGAYEAW